MRDSSEHPENEALTDSSEERLGCFLEEAMNLAQRGATIDVAASLADRPDLMDRGRRLVEGLESLQRAAATTIFPTARPSDETPLPDPFPREFRFRGLLGKGSFGKVWLADDLLLGRQVALKTLHLPADADPSALEALRKEATILASLDNRNVVKVHAWRQAFGEHYLVLGYVAGGSLANLLKEEGTMSWQRAARYIANVAEGLVEVHARYNGPRKLDHGLSYSWPRKRGNDGRQTADAYGSVQGPGRPGRRQGRSDHQRTGRPVRRPPHLDPRLEEALAPRRRGDLRPRCQQRHERHRVPEGRTVRADRTAQDGVGVAEKKSRPVRLSSCGP